MTSDQGNSGRLSFPAGKGKAKRSRRWIWIGGAAAIVLIGVGLAMAKHSPVVYVTQPVSRGALTITVSATGTLAPQDQVDVGAEVSGRVDELLVDYNDHVQKGQKIAKINTDQLEAQLGQMKAALAQSEATLVQSEAVYHRDQALLKVNALSPQQFETARADYFRAKGGVAQAQAQVANYETQLSKATIYSPIDGVVLDRKVSRGQTVVAAMTTPVLYTLASDLTHMELDVDIDEADVGSVRAGQAATFTVDAYTGKTFTARLTTVRNAPQTTNNVVTYKGVLTVDNRNLLLKPGMTATAEIVVGRTPNAMLVPNAALRFVPPESATHGVAPAPSGGGRGRVWTQQAGKLVPHDLSLGGTDGRLTEVMEGDLKPGTQVITDIQTPAAQ